MKANKSFIRDMASDRFCRLTFDLRNVSALRTLSVFSYLRHRPIRYSL